MGGGKGGGGGPGKGGGGGPGKGGAVDAASANLREQRQTGTERVTLETFLQRHQERLGPPIEAGYRPYCARCRRLEIRQDWLIRSECSVCYQPLTDLPTEV
jgi:hypothetical protein